MLQTRNLAENFALDTSEQSFDKAYYQELNRNLKIAEEEEKTSNLRYSVEDVRNSMKRFIEGAV